VVADAITVHWRRGRTTFKVLLFRIFLNLCIEVGILQYRYRSTSGIILVSPGPSSSRDVLQTAMDHCFASGLPFEQSARPGLSPKYPWTSFVRALFSVHILVWSHSTLHRIWRRMKCVFISDSVPIIRSGNNRQWKTLDSNKYRRILHSMPTSSSSPAFSLFPIDTYGLGVCRWIPLTVSLFVLLFGMLSKRTDTTCPNLSCKYSPSPRMLAAGSLP
jgi:hypothetical protein